jgi:hypothetical protein
MPTILASDIMAISGALLNDPTQVRFTNTVQLPYLKLAVQELAEHCEEYNIEVTNETSSAIRVTAGVTLLNFTTTPALPSDLIEIRKVSERLYGTTDDYNLMSHVEFLPKTQQVTDALGFWMWGNQSLQFIGANVDREIKLDYIGNTITAISSAATPITLINAQTFLEYRTASLCANFIGQNPTRSQALDQTAGPALDRFLSINIKGKQSIPTRRRPFRARFKQRGF